MNEPLSSLELLPEEEGGANLTYFAFAAPTASAPDLPAVLPSPLPDVLSGATVWSGCSAPAAWGRSTVPGPAP